MQQMREEKSSQQGSRSSTPTYMSGGRVVLGRAATAGQQDQRQGLSTIVPYVPAATFLPPETPPQEKRNLYEYPHQTVK